MRPRSGAFWVALWLWVLWTLGVASDSRRTVPRRCLLSHYRSLDPRALAAVKALRDSYVSGDRPPALRPALSPPAASARPSLSPAPLRPSAPAT